jgi:hypothetical protein
MGLNLRCSQFLNVLGAPIILNAESGILRIFYKIRLWFFKVVLYMFDFKGRNKYWKRSNILNCKNTENFTNCGSIRIGVAQLVERRLVVRQARVRFSARHPLEVPPLSQQRRRKNGPQRMFVNDCMNAVWKKNQTTKPSKKELQKKFSQNNQR